MFEIKEGPHGGFWILNNGNVYMWCYNREWAEIRLSELLSAEGN